MTTLVVTAASLGLLGVVAWRWCGTARAAAASTALFATMPLVWSSVRDGAPQLLLLPSWLAWLLAVVQYERTSNAAWAAAAGAAIATMLYLHPSAMVMVPVYLVVTVAPLLLRRDRVRGAVGVALGAAVVGLPWVWLTWQDPAWFSNVVAKYGLYDAARFNILQGTREMLSWIGLTVRSEVYWDSFNPALLFLGRGTILDTVWRSEVFLLPFALPLVIGLARYARESPGLADWIVLGAFLAAPATIAVLAQPPVPGRLLLMAPAAALIATRPLARRGAGSPPPALR